MIINVDVLEAAAKALTGFDVTVRQRKPAVVGTWGLCHQSIETGERFIDINPSQPREKFFFNFLHECGHWKIQNGELMPTDVHKLEPGTLDFSEHRESEEAQCEELAADTLAEKWNDWAEAHANKNVYLMCPELAKAIVLTQYETT